MKQSKHKCSDKAWGPYRSGKRRPCQRPGTVLRNGKWYCWQHDPLRVKADKEKRRAKWRAKHDAKWMRWARQAAEHRVCVGVSTEDLAKLEDGAVRRLLP